MIYDVVIIGGGPGGYTAALYCSRGNLRTLVLEKLSPGGQMSTTNQVDNYPGFPNGINGFDLAMQMKQGAERFGAETSMKQVTWVDLRGRIKKIQTDTEQIQGRAVILATGAVPRLLSVPGESAFQGKGVSYCATCDGMFFRGKSVAVVGGGNTAASDALYLSRICKEVFLIHRRDRLRASAAYRKPLADCKNLRILYRSRITEVLGDQLVTGVRIQENPGEAPNFPEAQGTAGNRGSGQPPKPPEVHEAQTLPGGHALPQGQRDPAAHGSGEKILPVDGVFVAVGKLPNTALFKGQIDLNEAGYVLADETTQTSLPGVFAVGDLREKPLRQIITAASDGAVASYFAEAYLAQE